MKAKRLAVTVVLSLSLTAQSVCGQELPHQQPRISCAGAFSELSSTAGNAGSLTPLEAASLGGSAIAPAARNSFFDSWSFRGFNRLLKLRYRTRVEGIDEIKKGGDKGILFLFNHPGYIDPPVVVSALGKDFQVAPLMDKGQTQLPVVGPLIGAAAKRAGTTLVADTSKEGARGRINAQKAIEELVEKLKSGKNVLLYPSGALTKTGMTEIGSKSIVEAIIKKYPDVRIVMGRTTGLWGSSFSWGAKGMETAEKKSLIWPTLKGIAMPFLNGIFFMPKREVSIVLREAKDFPRTADRLSMNKYLENYFNAVPQERVNVPYHFLQGWKGKKLTPALLRQEVPSIAGAAEEIIAIGDKDREKVLQKIAQIAGKGEFTTNDKLAHIGLDSMDATELVAWLEQEFKHPVAKMEDLVTVGDALKIAAGLKEGAVDSAEAPVLKASKAWTQQVGKGRAINEYLPNTITEAFFEQARRNPEMVIAEDELSGPVTYRKLIMGINLFKPIIEKMKGDTVGIMLPPSVANVTAQMAAMLAGKKVLAINFTAAEGTIKEVLEHTGVEEVITAGRFVDKLEREGYKMGGYEKKFTFLEDWKEGFSIKDLGKAWWNSRGREWRNVRDHVIQPSDNAVTLFTSGSEGKPGIVPLTHANIMADLRGVTRRFPITDKDSLMAFLPPFHSFGTAQMALSVTRAIPAVYYANARDGRAIARHISAYGTTTAMGTPHFLEDILKRSEPGQLVSLDKVISGAAKLPETLREQFLQDYPKMGIFEGYGITETSPVLAVNGPNTKKPGSVGKLLAEVDYRIVDPENGQVVAPGEAGILLVRGPNVFHGYLNPKDKPVPFRTLEGKSDWFYTGDMAKVDKDRFVYFQARLSRSYKTPAGEFINVDAIERGLEKIFPASAPGEAGGVPFAVERNSANNHILFTTVPMTVDQANAELAAQGVPKSHFIQRVVQVDQIPALGTGKTDYKVFKRFLKDEEKGEVHPIGEYLAGKR